MDMQDIEKKMEMEIDEERAEFAKKFLKRKRLELESLIKQQEHLDCKIADAEEEYDEILGMSVEDVYEKYKGAKYLIELEDRNGVHYFHGGGIITGSYSTIFGND